MPARLANAVMRHPLLTVFTVALVVRIVIAVALSSSFSGTLVLDNSTYHQMAVDQASENVAGWDDQTYQLYGSTAAFMFPVTVLYELFGPDPLVGQMFVALLGSAAALLVGRLALEFSETRWAIVAGLTVALLPSQAFWSSMLMKDASVWFALTGLALGAAVASRATGRQLFIAMIPAAACLLMLSYLRLHTLVVASLAFMLTSFFGIKKGRLVRIGTSLVLGVTIPWVFGGIGPAGFSLITNHGSLEERRFFNAQGAATAIVPADGRDEPVGQPAPQREKETGASRSRAEESDTDPNQTSSPPWLSDSAESPLDPNLRHVPRGLSVMLLEPFPLPFEGSISLRLARLESLLWYPLLLLGLVGLWKVRPYVRQMAFPVLAGGGILIVYALSEGNVGTAHRHRGEFVWAIALLAVLGLRHLAEARKPASD
jgi:hypothetical protein